MAGSLQNKWNSTDLNKGRISFSMYAYLTKEKKNIVIQYLSVHFLTQISGINIPERWIWDSSTLNICQKQTSTYDMDLDKIILLHRRWQRISVINHYSLNTVVKMLNTYKALAIGFSYTRTNLQTTVMKNYRIIQYFTKQ